jgi:hypothetical protein
MKIDFYMFKSENIFLIPRFAGKSITPHPKWDGHLARYDRLEVCSTKGEGIIFEISNIFV